jgi:hypothetical protein
MNTSALILMVATQLTVLGVTAYFFFRVLRTPSRPEPDSYTDNDPN